MPTESEITSSIESKVNYYGAWTIGITDDTERRKQEHGNPTIWYDWDARTETITRKIEKYFLDKGMKGSSGGGINPTYVYIFIE
jgi:hypothetical protein